MTNDDLYLAKTKSPASSGVASVSVLQFQVADTFFDIRDIGMQHILDIPVCKSVLVECQVFDSPPYLIDQSDSPVRILVETLYTRHRAVFYYLYDILCIVKQTGNTHYKFFFRKSHLFYQKLPVSC